MGMSGFILPQTELVMDFYYLFNFEIKYKNAVEYEHLICNQN